MGYTTDFTGSFEVEPSLMDEHREYLLALSSTRRMKRDPSKTAKIRDLVRARAGLPVGDEGMFFVGSKENFGQNDSGDIVDYNSPPGSQPSLWCQWEPSDDGQEIRWNGAEKFYKYAEWIAWIKNELLDRWGYELSGHVAWQGEDHDDWGMIVVADDRPVPVFHGQDTGAGSIAHDAIPIPLK